MGLLEGQLGKLTIEERILLCREHAQEAEQLTQAAHPDRKGEYKLLAAGWHQVASEMEVCFDGRAFVAMPLPERLKMCVTLAARAQTLAKESSSPHQEQYLLMADEWLKLAGEIQKTIAELPQLPG